MNQQIEKFVEDWISDNVHNIPGLADLGPEVTRLSQDLRRAAQSAGISPAVIEKEKGSIEDFLTEAYENIYDPELGFKD